MVLVLPGTYTARNETDTEVVNLLGKEITLASLGGPETCIIDANLSRRGIVCVNGETSATLIDGFTIRNGASLTSGAGIRISEAAPSIEDCILENNIAFGDGGGIQIDGGRLLITRCAFDGNAAANGGGLAVSWTTPESGRDLTLAECTFSGNLATEAGGGVHASGLQTLKLSGCTFEGDNATDGGGIAVELSDQLTILGGSFSRLGATGSGGGLFMQGGAFSCTGSLFRDFEGANPIPGMVMRLEAVTAELRKCTFESMPLNLLFSSKSDTTLVSASDCTLKVSESTWQDCENYNLDATGTGTLTVEDTIFTTSREATMYDVTASAIRSGPEVELIVTSTSITGYTATARSRAAGIECHNRATIDDCSFRKNYIEYSGNDLNAAHVFIRGIGTGSTVTNCTFEEGFSVNATSGLRTEDIGALTIIGCTFRDGDDAENGGGALELNTDLDPATSVVIDQCIFINNGGTNTDFGGGYGGVGGAISSPDEVITIRESWFERNHAFVAGSLYGYFEVTNCYVDGDAGDTGGAIGMLGGSVTNSKLFGTSEFYSGAADIFLERGEALFQGVTARGFIFDCECKGEEESVGATIEIQGETFSMGDSYICGGGAGQGIPLRGGFVDLGGNYKNENCCFADLDHDGSVGGGDLAILLGSWGSGCLGCQADLDDNGVVDGADLSMLLGDWNGCG